MKFESEHLQSMKRTPPYIALISLFALLLGSGCNPTASPQNALDTAAVSDTSRQLNAQRTDIGPVPQLKEMQLALTTGLSRNEQGIKLGRGLYFFKSSPEEITDTIGQYGRDHTNLTLVLMFTAHDNYDNAWYVGDTSIDLRHFAEGLNISNGVFAVFRDKPLTMETHDEQEKIHSLHAH